ncbi:MAG TPA: efflux transporter outer membrane subunit [Allosphingosinicella sp.]|nr:efflux transporter outer membrane subunit [Allosphingosinicella sp.]
MRKTGLPTTSLIAALGLGACAPRVALEPTPVVQSQQWSEQGVRRAEEVAEATPGSATLGSAMGSPALDALIDQASRQNTDLAVAVARIRQSRALLRIARGAMLPAISASAGISATRTDQTRFDFRDAFGGLDISFELDLFGGRRAEADAARGRFRATEFDREAVLLAVQADVARAFVQQATLAARLALIDRNIAQQRELERIIRARVDAGEGTRVDLGLQTIQVRQLQSERSRLEEALERTRTSLAVLVGEEAPRFRQSPAALEALVVPAVRLVQPTELVARRPDVRAAEARIQAAGGDVRAARAAFYPRLTLSSRGLSEAAVLGGPLSTLYSTGAGLLAPIFDRGRLRGNLEFAAGQQAESVALYRQALLNCLADVENAISAVNRSGERAAITGEIVAQARETARLARLQYLEGDADLQRLFDAEQRLIENEDARLLTLQERLEAAIDLYKALGGMPARL